MRRRVPAGGAWPFSIAMAVARFLLTLASLAAAGAPASGVWARRSWRGAAGNSLPPQAMRAVGRRRAKKMLAAPALEAAAAGVFQTVIRLSSYVHLVLLGCARCEKRCSLYRSKT